MVNRTTSAQRYNARMDKIFENARRLKSEEMKSSEWTCSKASLGNNEWECESKRGNTVSLQPNGSVRFTKFNCDKTVEIDGKRTKDKCGVELS